MRNIITFVLGGGRGTRLFPLTKYRSKPAVPLAGKYRLIDIPLSNCINSGLNRVYVLTQFMSVSLHRHIRRTYQFDAFDGGFVEILAAQQTLEGEGWYQGTADAVRQQIRYVQQLDVSHVLILSGDQLYRMNYADMFQSHVESGADVSIAGLPVAAEEAASLGIMRIDDSGRVVGFLEKPKTEKELDIVRMDPAWIDQHGIESRGRDCLANMGIYLFNRDTLLDVLLKTDYQDFGKEVFPASIRSRHVQLHVFDGYWEDIGTIKAFYQSNLDLAAPNPSFALYSANAPIYSRPRFLPPSRFDGAAVKGSLVADGCIIEEGSVIENSVIGLRCRIGRDVQIRNSILMGADFYELPSEVPDSLPAIGVGNGSQIDGAIVDKNCRIGANVRISNSQGLLNAGDDEDVVIRDGIVVVSKEAALTDAYSI